MKSVARDTSARSTSAWTRITRPDGAHPDPKLGENDRKIRLILREQQASRLRSTCFDGLKLRNPTWDMLVALLAARRNGTHMSMSELCLMCDAPESTALRLIHQLRDKGYAELAADRSDRRRTRVTLTRLGEAEFETYLDRIDGN